MKRNLTIPIFKISKPFLVMILNGLFVDNLEQEWICKSMFLPQVCKIGSERVLFLANTIPSYLRIWSISITFKNGN